MDNVTSQFDNQINYDNLQKLENRISDIENHLYYTSNQFITTSNVTSSVEGVHDGTPIRVDILEKLIPSTLLDWVLLVSGFFSVGLVILVGIQTVITRNEVKNRLRPWIKILDPMYDFSGFIKLSNGKTIPWTEYWTTRDSMDLLEVEKIILNMTAINGGSNPSIKTSVVALFSDEITDKKNLRESPQVKKSSPLMPNEEIKWGFNISPRRYVESFENPFYLSAECTYESGNRIYRIGKIWSMKGTVYETKEYWFDEKKGSKFT